MTSSPLLKRQAFKSSLRHQASSSELKHQAWLTTHVRNTENLAGLICPSDRSNRLGLSISSGIVSPPKRSASLVCPFYLALWNNENFSLMVLDGVYLGPDEWSQTSYMFALIDQKVLSMGMTRGGPPQCPIIHLSLSDKVVVRWGMMDYPFSSFWAPMGAWNFSTAFVQYFGYYYCPHFPYTGLHNFWDNRSGRSSPHFLLILP